jgi:hypothetical protein
MSTRRSAAATRLAPAALVLALLASAGAPARADEGMWLLTNPPLATLKERYGFAPDAAWLDHAQRAAVRISSGGSGSFVSADGLVMTNHHVASDAIAALSTKERDLLAQGFHARTPGEELKIPGAEILSLQKITDVTESVNAGVPAGAELAAANIARRKTIAEIEKAAQDESGLFSQVVTLYQGARYHLYQYRRYTDVRLVFAPEKTIAFFGGDTDNFEYPRFNLDVTFYRVYENDKPAKIEQFFRWSPNGSNEGDLAIVLGHPGSTRRGYTLDHVRHVRDVELPRRLARSWRSEIKLQGFAARSPEHRRVSEDALFGVANGRKASTGIMSGLADPAILGAKEAQEKALRDWAAANLSADEARQLNEAFAAVAAAQTLSAQIGARADVLSRPLGGEYAAFAKTIVRLAAELPKPSPQRLREFGDARLPSVYRELYSDAPVYDFFEVFQVEQALLRAVETLGGDDPIVKILLGGKSPAARAEELVAGVSFKTPDARKKLVEGGSAALAEAIKHDPMLALFSALDGQDRALRARTEDEIEAVERDAYARIAAARFAMLGDSVYPDATFTLRLSFGPIKGYVEGGTPVPAYTTIAGTFERYAERKGQEGFELPASWLGAKDRLNGSTPFNFVCTADIIGGNSGSPVVNTRGEVIGLIFDGNIHSLVANIQYAGDGLGRAVSVDSRAIIEALSTVYGATDLVRELRGEGGPSASR